MNLEIDDVQPILSHSVRQTRKPNVLEQILEDCYNEFEKYISKQLSQYQGKKSHQTDLFKNQTIFNSLNNIVGQISGMNSFKELEKQGILRTFQQLISILKSIGNGQTQISIPICQTILNIERDTLRQIVDLQDLLGIMQLQKTCGKDLIQRQFDSYFRRIQQYLFFWENIIHLENSKLSIQINKQSLLNETDLLVKMESWLLKIKNESIILKNSNQKLSQITQELNAQTQKNQELLLFAHENFAGLGRTRNHLEAIKIYKSLAESNNPIAQAIMGQLISEGIYFDQDFDEAFSYFSKSADQKYTFSIFQAASLILNGKVSNKLFQENDVHSQTLSQSIVDECQFAIAMLKTSAEMKHVDSMLYLGDLYFQGHQLENFILERDFSMAEFYYKEAKKFGSFKASYKLAQLYLEMSKIKIHKKRIKLVQDLLQEAKNQDYLPAYYELYVVLKSGIEKDIPPNILMAELILEQGAYKGNEQCIKELLEQKFQLLQQQVISFEEFIDILNSIDQNVKKQNFTIFYRAKIQQLGLFNQNIDIEQALTLFIQGIELGCEKCKQEILLILKENKKDYSLNLTTTFKPQLGFLQQIKQSDWKNRFKKVSIGTNPYKSVNEIDQTTIPDNNQPRPTISIVKTPKIKQDLINRRRGISDYTQQCKSIQNRQCSLLSFSRINNNNNAQEYQTLSNKNLTRPQQVSIFSKNQDFPQLVRNLSQNIIPEKSQNTFFSSSE